MTAGAHGSTFGGNPIAAAAALAVLDTIRDEGLLERAKELEHRFTAGIEGARPPGHRGRPGEGRAARRRPHRRRRRRAGDAAAGRRLPHQRRRPRGAPARPAPGAHRRAGRRLRRRPARRPRLGIGDDHDPPALPQGRRPQPRRAGRGAGAGRLAQAHPAHRRGADAAGRPARGRRPVRQALHPHPGVVLDRRRRARRLPAGHRRRQQPARPGRAGRGHHPRARPAGRRDRLAHLRPGPDRGDGLGQPGAGGQRADRRVPPVPDPGRPADGARAEGHARRADADLPRRRRQQHGALLPARRRHRRHARADRLAGGVPARPAVLERAAEIAAETGGSVLWTADAAAAADGADVLATDTWVSMGQEDEYEARIAPVPALRGRRGGAGPGRRRRRRPALPARLPRQGDRRRGHRRPAERGLGRGREPAARPEGAAALAAGDGS